jgi:hypothetical protein
VVRWSDQVPYKKSNTSITCCHFLIVEVAEVQGYPRGRGFFMITSSELFLQIVIFVVSKRSSFRVYDGVGSGVAL